MEKGRQSKRPVLPVMGEPAFSFCQPFEATSCFALRFVPRDDPTLHY
jgi:hypothetical protein